MSQPEETPEEAPAAEEPTEEESAPQSTQTPEEQAALAFAAMTMNGVDVGLARAEAQRIFHEKGGSDPAFLEKINHWTKEG